MWLSGTALRWYEPNLELEDYDLPDFTLDWEVFEETLKTTFGEPNPVATTAHKLGNLTMRDGNHITRYNIDFNKYAVLTGFDKRALPTMYYKGFTPRIKDGLMYSSRPGTLRALQTQAQNLNLRYWERRDEDRAYDKSTPVLHIYQALRVDLYLPLWSSTLNLAAQDSNQGCHASYPQET